MINKVEKITLRLVPELFDTLRLCVSDSQLQLCTA